MQQKTMSLPSLLTPPCVVDVVPPHPVSCHGLVLIVIFCPVAAELVMVVVVVAVQVVSVNSVLQSLILLFGSHNILIIAIVLLGGHLPISVVRHDAVIANISIIIEGLVDIDISVVAVLDTVRLEVVFVLFTYKLTM